jgi:P-type E1-E2 ATPase
VIAPADLELLLLGLALFGGAIALALALAGDSKVALTARLVVVIVAAGSLVAQYTLGRRDASTPHPIPILTGPALATLLAAAAVVTEHASAASAISFAALVVCLTAAQIGLIDTVRGALDAEREQIAAALEHEARRVAGDTIVSAAAADLRPGEEILLEPGDTLPVDAQVVAGTATVLPWIGATAPLHCDDGQTLVAGARVVEGRLRAIVAWAGNDRAWIRLTNDPRRRADLHAPLAQLGRHAAERWAPLAAGLAALTTYAGNQNLVAIMAGSIAAYWAVANVGVAQIASVHVLRAVLSGLRRGIVYRSAEALDRAGRVQSVAFCARGTLLLGEPEVTNVEAIGQHEGEHVLSLVAGAESAVGHPISNAVLRAARARDVRPDAVRSPTYLPGLGVTAVAASGQSLVVGNRALMLKERISVAMAEHKITDLEAMGRTVLLAAVGGKLVGAVGLQDGLRPGARASVQHLLDVGVEPVLLSGESRETCDALGRTLDIEHLRPEVLPSDRGEEIRRLADGGAVVAVIGTSPQDDVALAAADVSVALATAGSSVADYSVQLASDDVRDGAYAIRLAHRCRSNAKLGLILTLASGVAGGLAVGFALVTPAVAPVMAFAGTLGALYALRTARD